MSKFSRSMPVYVAEPNPESRSVVDRLHSAIFRGKLSAARKLFDCGVSVELPNPAGQTPLFVAAYCGHLELVRLLLRLGADPNRRCSLLCCTAVHGACYSGNTCILTALLIAGGDLRLCDQNNRTPRDWALLQARRENQLATLSHIESFRQMAMRGNDLNSTLATESASDMNSHTPGTLNNQRPSHHPFKMPSIVRNTLAAMGLGCNDNYEYTGPLGNVQGTGFGKLLFGRGESAAALWPVPLVGEAEINDPDDGGSDAESLNGLLPRGIAYRSGPTTEMVPRRWHQTPVTIRRMKEHQSPDVLLEELKNMSRLRHPGLVLLLGVCPTHHWDSMQLIYEPIYCGSLHHRLHVMGSAIPLSKKLRILQQICDALLFLHSKNLIHCSVSSHAVHMISSGRAKLGCLETLTETVGGQAESRRVFRKVPSSHWDWLMPWLSPECVKGEIMSNQSDVYSFCCLVWESMCERVPWNDLDSKRIARMWQRQDAVEPLDLGPEIPSHVNSFLKLGLQPEISDRREVDLQEIFLMLRLQAAKAMQQQPSQQPSHHKQKNLWRPSSAEKNFFPPSSESHAPSSPTSMKVPTMTAASSPPQTVPIPPPLPVHPNKCHDWDAVKQKMRSGPPPPPPFPAVSFVRPVPVGTVLEPLLEVSDDHLDEGIDETETSHTSLNKNNIEPDTESTVPCVPACPAIHKSFTATPSPNDFTKVYVLPKGTRSIPQCTEFAIKPASHTTERHSSNCSMSTLGDRSATSPPSYYQTPNHPEDLFKATRIYVDHDDRVEPEMVDVTGLPSSTSTPRHPHDRQEESFLACSSLLVEDKARSGTKPKRSLKFFKPIVSPSSRIPSMMPSGQPSTDIVASLKALFQSNEANRKHDEEQAQKGARCDSNIGDTILYEDATKFSRGTQYTSEE